MPPVGRRSAHRVQTLTDPRGIIYLMNQYDVNNGQRAISGDTALHLAHFFGTSPQFWLNLQSLYEIRLAEEKSGRAIKKLPSLKRVDGVHA